MAGIDATGPGQDGGRRPSQETSRDERNKGRRMGLVTKNNANVKMGK